LSKDALFVDFFEGSTKFLICEDADAFLTPRCKGNQFVQKFLNVAEGLISNKDKKIILTTNLSSINDMDQALVRPGRCFDILDFPELNRKEAEILAKKFDLDLDFSGKTFTMAEVLNVKKSNKVKSIGFC
jgi:ATP-dependent 26S proteasome regulatory subunit